MKKITIATIVATILIGIVAISVLPAEAHGPPHIHEILDALNNILAAVSGTSTEVSNIEAKLDDPNFGLQEIKNEVSNIETNVNNNLDATVSSLKTTPKQVRFNYDLAANPIAQGDGVDVLSADIGRTLLGTCRATAPSNVGVAWNLMASTDGFNFESITVATPVGSGLTADDFVFVGKVLRVTNGSAGTANSGFINVACTAIQFPST